MNTAIDLRLHEIKTRFLKPMSTAYAPPPHVAGEGMDQQKDRLLVMLTEAALQPVPKTWDADRVRVYASRLWDWFMGHKRAPYWPLVDEVVKAGTVVVNSMRAAEAKAAGSGDDLPITPGFANFQAHMARVSSRPLSQSTYMAGRSEAYAARYGHKALAGPTPAARDVPLMGTEPDFPAFRARMEREYDLTALERRILAQAQKRWEARYGNGAHATAAQPAQQPDDGFVW